MEAAWLFLDDSEIKTPVHHSKFTSKGAGTSMNILNHTLPGYINQNQDKGYIVITVTRVRGSDHDSAEVTADHQLPTPIRGRRPKRGTPAYINQDRGYKSHRMTNP